MWNKVRWGKCISVASAALLYIYIMVIIQVLPSSAIVPKHCIAPYYQPKHQTRYVGMCKSRVVS